jgi:hypothetical protein
LIGSLLAILLVSRWFPLRHYLARQAGRTNMWHAALSLIVSTWATERVAKVERSRFLGGMVPFG